MVFILNLVSPLMALDTSNGSVIVIRYLMRSVNCTEDGRCHNFRGPNVPNSLVPLQPPGSTPEGGSRVREPTREMLII